jgi:hypothetical protein
MRSADLGEAPMEDKRTAEQSKANAGLHSFDEPDSGPPPGSTKTPGTYSTPELASFDEPDPGPTSGGGKLPGTYSTSGDDE